MMDVIRKEIAIRMEEARNRASARKAVASRFNKFKPRLSRIVSFQALEEINKTVAEAKQLEFEERRAKLLEEANLKHAAESVSSSIEDSSKSNEDESKGKDNA